jgi:methionyl aminopeptidase
MVLAVEPMVNDGGYEVITLGDGWTVVTQDRRLSAHYENTIVVTPEGVEILTF